MYRRLATLSAPDLRRWGAYLLVLLAPGSLIVVLMVVLVRLLRAYWRQRTA